MARAATLLLTAVLCSSGAVAAEHYYFSSKPLNFSSPESLFGGDLQSYVEYQQQQQFQLFHQQQHFLQQLQQHGHTQTVTEKPQSEGETLSTAPSTQKPPLWSHATEPTTARPPAAPATQKPTHWWGVSNPTTPSTTAPPTQKPTHWWGVSNPTTPSTAAPPTQKPTHWWGVSNPTTPSTAAPSTQKPTHWWDVSKPTTPSTTAPPTQKPPVWVAADKPTTPKPTTQKPPPQTRPPSSQWVSGTKRPTTQKPGKPHKPSTANKPQLKEPDSPIGYSISCGVNQYYESRIVGGANAEPGQFPWQVSVQLVTGWTARHVCGGAVLAEYWVITAAHCVDHLGTKSLTVVAGDHNLYEEEGIEQRVYVNKIITHGYVAQNFSHDIALLQLSKPLKLDGDHVAPICLPQPTVKYRTGNGTVTGWGRLTEDGTLPHILQHVSLPFISTDLCKKWYVDAGYGQYVNPCQLCSGYGAGGADSCQGDSGGPMACLHSDSRYYLCGVVSWGVGCARRHLPGVYTEVPCFSEWIKSVLYNETSNDS